MALQDATNGCSWGEMVDIPALPNNDITIATTNILMLQVDGYNDTQIIRAYQNNNPNYAAGTVDFAHGWYLPAAGQMRMLVSNWALIQTDVIAAGGTDLGRSTHYWTSTEINENQAWYISSNSWGGFFTKGDKNNNFAVRAIHDFTMSPPVGPVTYLWNTGATTQSITVSPSQTSTYSVTVSSGFECESTAQKTITVNNSVYGDTVAQTCVPFTWYGTTYAATGNYEHTLESSMGCDSIVTLHLTIGDQVYGDTIAATCEPLTWYGTTYSISGNYEHTLQSQQGCDSIVTLHLTIGEEVYGDTVAYRCESLTWYGTTYSVSGNYEHTLQNAIGCDSIVTLHLTIGDEVYGDTIAASCEPLTWYGTTYSISGNYEHTLQSQQGCDSIVTLHLTIGEEVYGDTVAYRCESLTWYGTTYSVSGNYEHTLQNSIGCDSIVTLHLTIGDKVYGDTIASTCEPLTWYGTTYSISGNYEHTLQSQQGCDSIVTLDLTIIDPQMEIYGYSNVFSASDLWPGLYHYYIIDSTDFEIDTLTWACTNSNWILVPVSNFHCMLIVRTSGSGTLYINIPDTSDCLDEVAIDIDATEYSDDVVPEVLVFPNPASTEVRVLAQNMQSIRFLNAFGQVVKHLRLTHLGPASIDIQDLANGFYIIEIITPSEIIFKRLVISR